MSHHVGGYESLSEWLRQQGVSPVHGYLEATNTYGNGVASYLHQHGQSGQRD